MRLEKARRHGRGFERGDLIGRGRDRHGAGAVGAAQQPVVELLADGDRRVQRGPLDGKSERLRETGDARGEPVGLDGFYSGPLFFCASAGVALTTAASISSSCASCS